MQQLRLFSPLQRFGVLVVGGPTVDVSLLRRVRRARRLEVVGAVDVGELAADPASAATAAAAVVMSMPPDGTRAVVGVLERLGGLPLIVVADGLGDDGLRVLEAGAEEVVPAAEATAARLERAVLSAVHRRSGEPRQRAREVDPLTGLSTRTVLERELPDLLGSSGVAVLYCDLDRFKAINDTHGHEAGDQVLTEAAARLLGSVRSSDLVVRIGGDEFVVVVQAAKDIEAMAEEVGRRIVSSFSAPFSCSGARFSLSVSVGLAVHRPGESAKELVVRADRALYLAKRRGKARVARYDHHLERVVAERATSAELLAEGLRRDLLEVEVRPVVDTAGATLQGHLYRPSWGGAPGVLGVACPAERVERVAESSGAGEAVLRWTLGHLAQDAAGPALPGTPRRRIVELPTGVLDASPGRLLDSTGVVAEDLVVVVDERQLADHDPVRPGLLELARRGVRVCVGRFGVEHASLALLDRHPFDGLWLDRQMVDGVSGCPVRRARLEAVAAVAAALGQHVVVDRPTVTADLRVVEDCCRVLVVDGAVDLTTGVPGGSSATRVAGLPRTAGEVRMRR